VATRVFADEELARLREFPEISREELFRYFTLTPADVAFVAPRGRGKEVRLGMAVIPCSLPWLGFVPDKVTPAPPVGSAARRPAVSTCGWWRSIWAGERPRR